MTINDPEAFIASLWDWAILDGCFGETRIKPTDVDGFVERNGKFLFIETKLPGVEVPTGQQIIFRRLIDLGCFSILVIWGYPGKPKKVRVITRKMDQIYENINTDWLRTVVSTWFTWANKQTPAPRFG